MRRTHCPTFSLPGCPEPAQKAPCEWVRASSRGEAPRLTPCDSPPVTAEQFCHFPPSCLRGPESHIRHLSGGHWVHPAAEWIECTGTGSPAQGRLSPILHHLLPGIAETLAGAINGTRVQSHKPTGSQPLSPSDTGISSASSSPAHSAGWENKGKEVVQGQPQVRGPGSLRA